MQPQPLNEPNDVDNASEPAATTPSDVQTGTNQPTLGVLATPGGRYEASGAAFLAHPLTRAEVMITVNDKGESAKGFVGQAPASTSWSSTPIAAASNAWA